MVAIGMTIAEPISIGIANRHRAAPRQAFSSSTSPYASTRESAFDTLVLSKSDVSPLSPVLV